jgi:hypothetical protein
MRQNLFIRRGHALLSLFTEGLDWSPQRKQGQSASLAHAADFNH